MAIGTTIATVHESRKRESVAANATNDRACNVQQCLTQLELITLSLGRVARGVYIKFGCE